MKLNFKDRLIGVWGFGVMGKSVVKYLIKQGAKLQVLDIKEISSEDKLFLEENNIAILSQDSLIFFLENNQIIIPSSGIDLKPYSNFKDKWLTELDIFSIEWKKSIIAITGTVGKTSITHLISNILTEKNFKIITGGNIGVGLPDLLEYQENYDYAVLELSSYQLENCKYFAPDYSIWTNFYENHLDRHVSMQEYFLAKYNIIANQTEGQVAILPLELQDLLNINNNIINRSYIYFTPHLPRESQIKQLKSKDKLIYISEKNIILEYSNNKKTIILDLADLPEISYQANWLIIIALLRELKVSYNNLKDISLGIPEHRGELVDVIDDIEFYNDSKSTIFESTLAAIKRLNSRPIILLLGGQSKGVDRLKLIEKFKLELKKSVAFIVCFGIESETLAQACRDNAIPAKAFENLEKAFAEVFLHAKPGMRVLFSPAGSSFDLFKDYKERGKVFVELVKNLKNKQIL